MSVALWHTYEPEDAEFARRWATRLARAPHAHFGLEGGHLRWEAAHGRHATLALVEEAGRGGALVLRHEGGGRVSGWPWRWQMVVEDPARVTPEGLDPEETEWLMSHAQRLAGSHRLTCFTPHPPRARAPGFAAGATTLRAIGGDDEEVLRSLDTNKRRLIRRARSEGFVVEAAGGIEALRAFARLQRETERRRGVAVPDESTATPAAGEAWREWEHPWMRLLVAVRGGTIEAGSGYGIVPGGMMDYRANGSTLEAKKAGANMLLAFEALRLGRASGCRWMNWGGVTEFKREMGGVRVDVTCRLGGGAMWAVPNRIQATLRTARPRVAGWWHALRRGDERRRA